MTLETLDELLDTLEELLDTLEELLAVLLDELLDTDADVRHITGPEDELLPEQLSETTPSHPYSPTIKIIGKISLIIFIIIHPSQRI